MDLTALNVKDFKYLSALGKIAHFGKAAKACHVTQPTLSAQIKKIESILNLQVFERNNKKVFLTEVGKSIVELSNQILLDVNKFEQIKKNHQGILNGNLKIGIIPTLCPYFVPMFINEIKEKFNNLKLNIIEEKTEHLLKKLDKGLLDIVIISKNQPYSSYELYPLFLEPLVLMISKKNVLTQKNLITTKDLKNKEFIFLQEGNCLRENILHQCKLKSNLSHYQEVSSIETLRYMVAFHEGYTLIPKFSIQVSPALDQIIEYRNISQKNVFREIVMATRKSFCATEDLVQLQNFFQNATKNYLR